MMVHRRKATFASWQQIFQNQTASGYQQHMQSLDACRRQANFCGRSVILHHWPDALSGVLIDEPEGWIAREVFGWDLRDDVHLMLSPTRDL
jgi:hypothetical protein